MEKYISYNSTSDLHKELTNIMLLCTERSKILDQFCYCNEEIGDCGLCQLIEFCYDPLDENKIDGLSPENSLKVNFNNRSKLEEFATKILPFFKSIELNNSKAIDLLKEKRYSWSMRDFSGENHSLTLEDVIEGDKQLAENYPHLFKQKK